MKKAKPHFKDWYKSLNQQSQKSAKAKIQQACALRSNFIFNNWLYGRTPIAEIYQPKIEEVAGQKIDFTFNPAPAAYVPQYLEDRE